MSFSLPLQPSPLFFRSFASSSTPSGMTIRIAAALSVWARACPRPGHPWAACCWQVFPRKTARLP